MNPMLQFLNPKGNNLVAMINTVTSTFKMSKNPMYALQTLVQNNPQIQQIAKDAEDYVNNECGGDVELAVRKFADQSGINADAVMQMLNKNQSAHSGYK